MEAGSDGEFVREIRVYVVENRRSGLLVALSDEMKGLMVAGRTEEQIELEIPDAIREILEAEGHRVLSVTAAPDSKGISPEFSSPMIIASAHIAN